MRPIREDSPETGFRAHANSALVRENFGPYRPPFDVRADIERLLSAVDARYVVGLSSVVLSTHRGLNRERRRSKTKARGRKVAVREALGLYHHEWCGKPAWIELFVDSTLEWLPRFFFRWRILRHMILARTLFHELGHHLHATQAPVHVEPETVAERWRMQLTREAFVRLHPKSTPLLRVAAALLQPLRGWLNRTHRRRPRRGAG
jgi:hypothetical protein